MKAIAAKNTLDKMPKSVSQIKAIKEIKEMNRMDEMLNRALNIGNPAFLNMEKWRKIINDNGGKVVKEGSFDGKNFN